MGATVLPVLADIKPERFLPSSRSVAFRKAAWERVGGYPEWLDYCEDLIFDLRLKDEAFRFAFAPKAIAHFRPRSGLKSFWIQYYRYARGDGKASILRRRHLIRYLTYLLITPVLIFLGFWQNPLWWLLLVLGTSVILWTPYKRLLPMMTRYGLRDKLEAIALVPVIRVTGDFAKMTGYPIGVLWRLKKRGILESGI
jgi:cellulose synthase/poly-beta-1,6-N-acetylglucosamine synthase-like glycosyltransferase